MKNILAILLIVASVGIFYMLVEPTYQEIKVARAEKVEYDKAMNNSTAVTERKGMLEIKYNEMPPSDVERLEKFLPDSIDNIRLIIEIDKRAQIYNMVLRDTRVAEIHPDASSLEAALAGASGNGSLYGTGELSFTVTGTYEAYVSFVKDLENSLRLIDITAVTVTAKDSVAKDEQPDSYEFKTTIKTYWLKK
jgi:hypothetical protein